MITICAFVTRRNKWAIGAKILKAVEGCSHCGIIHPVNGKLMVSDMTGDGFKVQPVEEWIKKYKVEALLHIKIDNNVNEYANGLELIDDLTLDFGIDIFKTKYAHGQLFWDALEILSGWIGFKDWNIKINGKRRQVCSEWVARFYNRYGRWTGAKDFDMVTLRDAHDRLKKQAHFIEGGL